MRIVIAGLGGIGERHLANLLEIEPSAHAIVWHQRRRPDTAGALRDRRVSFVYSLDEMLAEKPDVALITSPASLHVETGVALARRAVHLFVEKPLSNSLDGIDELVKLCSINRLVLMVGYCFRFYRPLRALRQAIADGRIGRIMSVRAEVGNYLPEWRPSRDYRKTVTARRELGGGVVLELSHELDYVRWIAGEVKTISAVVGRLGDLDIDVEDTAEILLEFASGAVGSVHLNMAQRAPSRGCRVVGTEGTLVWDGLKHGVRLYRADSREWSELHPADPTAYDDMYRVELRQFLDAVNGADSDGATAEDGTRVLELVFAVRQASDERRVILL